MDGDDFLTTAEVATTGAKILESMKDQILEGGETTRSYQSSRNQKQVASVVKSNGGNEPANSASMITEYKAKVMLDFEKDVLSGKLPKNPPS